MDEKEFFKEATLRICGSLEIDKALWQLLTYLRKWMPVDLMAFHVYDRDQSWLETVAVATTEGAKAMSVKMPLSAGMRKELDVKHRQPVWIANRWRDSETARLVMDGLNRVGLNVPGLDLCLKCGSGIVLKLMVEDEIVGALDVSSREENRFTRDHANRLAQLNDPLAIALSNSLRYRELCEIREMLADDKQYLEGELRSASGAEIIGSDFGLKGVMDLVRQVATKSSPVLLTGETGTGKEMIAGAIHTASRRKEGPLIKVNCGAIAPTLMDSELFGHEKGAFTGAIAMKRGRFERAHKGTVFLDEIGELTPEAQIRLLRVLQEKEIERVGGTTPLPVDIRVVAATHRDLEHMVSEERFREDLFFRLKVFPIAIPPLRDRREDIPTLVQHFMRKKYRELGLGGIPSLAPGAMGQLMAYRWPGNVRELENAVERAMILFDGKPLRFDDLGSSRRRAVDPASDTWDKSPLRLNDVVAGHIQQVMDMTGGRVEGPGGAAEILDINPGTLRQRMRKLGIPFGRRAKRAGRNGLSTGHPDDVSMPESPGQKRPTAV